MFITNLRIACYNIIQYGIIVHKVGERIENWSWEGSNTRMHTSLIHSQLLCPQSWWTIVINPSWWIPLAIWGVSCMILEIGHEWSISTTPLNENLKLRKWNLLQVKDVNIDNASWKKNLPKLLEAHLLDKNPQSFG